MTKREKRKRKPEDNNKSNLNAKKMKTKEDDIEVNKISRRQAKSILGFITSDHPRKIIRFCLLS